MLYLFIKIGFMEVDVIDLIDILVVGILLFYLYRLVKGSLAFNIFLGLVFVYLMWFVVSLLGMQLLQRIMVQFVNVGVIALLIVFQPEVRKILLYLGRGSLARRALMFRKFWRRNDRKDAAMHPLVQRITLALSNLHKSKTGCILVLCETSKLQMYANSGVLVDSLVSSKLLESIFEKTTPLHDGAVIISDMRIVAAGCVLPVSDNPELPSRIGMRHKATVGITEQSDAIAIVVSEERGTISYARNGHLVLDVSITEMTQVLHKFYEAYY